MLERGNFATTPQQFGEGKVDDFNAELNYRIETHADC